VLVTMWTFGSTKEHVLHHGDRIAQLVVGALAGLPVVEVAELSSSDRGAGGHGSTGR
jgi:dUTP pyrophosphatase